MAHDGSNLLSAFSTSTDASDDDLSLGGDLSLSLLDEATSLDADKLLASTNVAVASGSPLSFEFSSSAAVDSAASIGHLNAVTIELNIPTSGSVLADTSPSFIDSSIGAEGAPGAAGSLQTLSNYLTDGYWNATGRTARWFDVAANGGVLYYNIQGFTGTLLGEADTNGLTAARQTMAREAFKLYSAVLGINFVETTSSSTAVDFFFADNASGSAYEKTALYGGTGGATDYTVINIDVNWFGSISQIGGVNAYTFQTFIHEIGHALGLGHQGLYNAGSGTPTYANSAIWANDSWQQSMMSYWGQSENTEYSDDSYAQLVSPMAVDWIALNYLYGWQGYSTANAFTGNTVWGFGTNISTGTSVAYANLATYASTNAFTIVDGGGVDTIDFSNYNSNQVIDLFVSNTSMTHAWLSSVGGLTKNMTIAVGSIIENATGGGGNDTIWGNNYSNVLTGNAGNDYISSQDGGDTSYGGDGADTLASYDGNDYSYGGNGNDYIYSYGGNDYMGGNAGTDTVYGYDGNDTLWGYDGSGINENDLVYGGNGSDSIYVGDGAETVDGGTDTIGGIDAVYSISSANYVFNMATGATNQSGQVFYGFEIAYMGTGDDTVIGGAGASTIYGGYGNDSLSGGEGGGGVDVLYGGTGNDTLNGAGYNDDAYGGDGNDVFVEDSNWTVDDVYGGNDIDTLDLSGNTSGGGFDVNLSTTVYSYIAYGGSYAVTSVENVIGSNDADNIVGNSSDNILDGGAGNDTINDGYGGDTVYGGDGDDLVEAGDTLFIGDSWFGGVGTDTLSFAATANWGSAIVTFNFVTGEAIYNGFIETFSGFEIFQGNAGDDVIISDGLNHSFYGNDGNDSMVADFDLQFMYGGNGTDTLDATVWTFDVTYDMATGLTNFTGEQYLGFEVVLMGSGNDNVTGTSAAENIDGGSGDDSINGGDGTDTLYGGLGNDTLSQNYGGPNEILDGGDGTDTADWSYSTGDQWTINLATGTAKIGGVDYAILTSIENVVGGQLSDSITGNGGANLIDGQAGDDYVSGAAGNDTLIGGVGNDSIYGGTGNDSMVGGTGDDWFVVDSQTDIVVETAGEGTADRVFASVSYVLGAAADVEILSTISVGAATAINLTGNALSQTIYGNAGVNVLYGGDGNDSVYGFAGADTIYGGTGADSMIGGNDNDWYTVDSATDIVVELAGGGTADRVFAAVSYVLAAAADVEILSTTSVAAATAINLTGNALAQTIYGNAGINSLYGGDGNDSIFGFAGADILYGGAGNDSLVGGNDNDWYTVDNQADIVVEVGGGGTADRVFASVNYVLGVSADVEILSTISVGAFTAINLTGNGLSQTVYGNAGVNVLNGGDGNDSVYGFDGLDTIYGGNGNDSLVGGNDSDWIYVDNQADIVIELAGGGTADRVFSSVNYALSTTADVEILSTTSVAGLTAINLTGNGLTQTIYGNDGTNILNGGGGNDSLYGQGGTDTLNGGSGNDWMNGGLGVDSFVFDTTLGATNIDTISNYSVADDVIRLSSLIFTGLGSGGVTLSAGDFASNNTGVAVLANDHIIYQSNTGALFFDVDGVGGAAGKQFATITANLALFGNNEFILV